MKVVVFLFALHFCLFVNNNYNNNNFFFRTLLFLYSVFYKSLSHKEKTKKKCYHFFFSQTVCYLHFIVYTAMIRARTPWSYSTYESCYCINYTNRNETLKIIQWVNFLYKIPYRIIISYGILYRKFTHCMILVLHIRLV